MEQKETLAYLDSLQRQIKQKQDEVARRLKQVVEAGQRKGILKEKELAGKREDGKLRPCKVCGMEFEPIKPNQVFCSALCRTLYWKAYRIIDAGVPIDYKASIKCRACGNLFIPSGNRRVFCSESCAIAYQVKQSMQANKTPLLKLRFEVFMRDQFRCRYCGRSPLDDPRIVLVTDHMVPKSEGGNAELSNLVTSCFECNLGKRDVLLDERVVRKLLARNLTKK
jgi:predicted nucleic acid-binding Zn ribbon protein